MCDEDVVRRPRKKQFLGVFAKRQSRIEPEIVQNCNDTHMTRSEQVNGKPNFTPSKQSNKSPLNRLSGNFGLCCSTSAASTLSPNENEEFPIVKPTIRPRDHLKLDLELLNHENSLPVDTDPSERLLEFSHDISDNLEREKIEINLQKPILQSKSRFRNRYPPPPSQRFLSSRETQDVSNSVRFERCDQPLHHFSNPNLFEMSHEDRLPKERK